METAPTVYAVKLRTFAGDAMEAIAMVNDDGSMEIVTDDKTGFWSAHAYGAHQHYGERPVMSHEHHYTDRMGKKRVMTCWDRKSE